MKCNTRQISKLSPSERKKLSAEIFKQNEAWLRDTYEKMRIEVTHNCLKLLVLSSNEGLGLGSKRLEKVLEVMQKLLSTCDDRDDFWLHTDSLCKRILGKEIFYKYFDDWKMECFDYLKKQQ